jgi:hypothetical protein
MIVGQDSQHIALIQVEVYAHDRPESLGDFGAEGWNATTAAAGTSVDVPNRILGRSAPKAESPLAAVVFKADPPANGPSRGRSAGIQNRPSPAATSPCDVLGAEHRRIYSAQFLNLRLAELRSNNSVEASHGSVWSHRLSLPGTFAGTTGLTGSAVRIHSAQAGSSTDGAFHRTILR